MFDNQPTILSAGGNQPAAGLPDEPRSPLRKILLLAALTLAVILLIAVVYFVVRKYWFSAPANPVPKDNPATTAATSTAAASSTPTLPDVSAMGTATSTTATSTLDGIGVEYLTFADFYQAPDNKINIRPEAKAITNYELPLNIKIDVLNYYDVSRKVNLDPGLDNLNNLGFTVVDNPWAKEAPDFYSVYANLSSRQLPLLVTADFLIYEYQNIFKKTFKDIEENVFYDNLWDINKQMYAVAKNRYEARLAAIGNINDSVLEGERLETAYFATALELLKPTPAQITDKVGAGNGLFAQSEADNFYFTIPPYLRDDVVAEVQRIREARVQAKSPVLLYLRNYADFVVPADYRANAKLNNFYLTTKWLNSVFPLNYKGVDCPACFLDKADWRINLTAASLMAQDFSSLPELKSRWARIYKIMSFFKGLREDLNYVHYRDSLISVFGPEYKIENLFDDKNPQAAANLEKLRAKLLTYSFPAISGARNKNLAADKPYLGFKMLAEAYWPNDYIFGRLSGAGVGNYLGSAPGIGNITACPQRNTVFVRCNGLALDAVNLAYAVGVNPYFQENTNYVNYLKISDGLQQETVTNKVWHLNNYWTTLKTVNSYLSLNIYPAPYGLSGAWRNKSLDMAAGAWINLQLPLDNFSPSPVNSAQSLGSLSPVDDNSYVEPNLYLFNELLAQDNMLLKMLAALQLDTEVRLAVQEVKNFSAGLESLKTIVGKEFNGETLTEADHKTISDFVGQFKLVGPTAGKTLTIKMPSGSGQLKENLSRLRILVLIHKSGDSPVLSLGPVWSYQESR